MKTSGNMKSLTAQNSSTEGPLSVQHVSCFYMMMIIIKINNVCIFIQITYCNLMELVKIIHFFSV